MPRPSLGRGSRPTGRLTAQCYNLRLCSFFCDQQPIFSSFNCGPWGPGHTAGELVSERSNLVIVLCMVVADNNGQQRKVQLPLACWR